MAVPDRPPTVWRWRINWNFRQFGYLQKWNFMQEDQIQNGITYLPVYLTPYSCDAEFAAVG